jgi:GNAT superfamily N-acetyltransferase
MDRLSIFCEAAQWSPRRNLVKDRNEEMDAWRSFFAQADDRWQHIDKFLPGPEGWLKGAEGEHLVVHADNEVRGVGVSSQKDWDIKCPAAIFGTLKQFTLRAIVTGNEAPDGLDKLLAKWLSILQKQDSAYTPDSAAIVMWPSREVSGIRILLAHGLQPRVALAIYDSHAVRTMFECNRDPEVAVRAANYSDLDSIVNLWLEVIEYDDACGGGVPRSNQRQVIESLVSDQFEREIPWIWLATRTGSPVGLFIADEARYCDGISPLVKGGPISYTAVLGVSESERGKGVGRQLVAAAHAEIDRHGDSLKMLHYAVSNPMSVQFWVRMGYRPLWTEWSVTPASALR